MMIHLMGFHLPTVCGLIVPFRELLPVLVTTLLFVFLGLVIFALAFVVIQKELTAAVPEMTAAEQQLGQRKADDALGPE